MDKKIIFLLKAGDKNGLGHLSRCLTLAKQIVKLGSTPVLRILSDGDKKVINYLQEKNFDHYTLYSNKTEFLKSLIQEKLFADLMYVKDYYGQDNNFENICKTQNIKWAEFDYKHDREIYNSHFIINPNPNIKEINYINKVKPTTNFLIGLDYSIISEETKKIKNKRDPQSKNILISLGGGDLPKAVLKFIGNITDSKEYDFYIESNDVHISKILKSKTNTYSVNNKGDLESSYIKCKYGITAGGVTSHEMAYLGIKMIFYPFSENHYKNVENWSILNFGMQYESYLTLDKCVSKLDRLEPLEKIDGCGALRIANSLLNKK